MYNSGALIMLNNKIIFFLASEDVWDDSALIKAYDKAINLAKDEVVKRLGLKKEESPSKKDSVSPKENRQAKKSQRVCVHFGTT